MGEGGVHISLLEFSDRCIPLRALQYSTFVCCLIPVLNRAREGSEICESPELPRTICFIPGGKRELSESPTLSIRLLDKVPSTVFKNLTENKIFLCRG